MQALNEPTNTRRPTKTTVVAARKKRSMALDAVLFFVTTFFLYKEKDGSKVDAAVGKAFLRKKSRRSSAIFGSFLNLVVAPKLTPSPARLTHP